MNMEVATKQKAIGYLLLFMAATFWATSGVMGLMVKDTEVTPLEVGFWRALIGGGMFIIHALFTNNCIAKTKDRLLFMAFGLPVAIQFGSKQIGVYEIGMSMTSMLQYTSTAWIVLWGVIFFKDTLTKWKVLAATMAIVGAIVLCIAGGTIAQGMTFYV